jgi:hypothetical protein
MSNFTLSLKSEISRVRRREIKSSVGPLRASTVKLKKTFMEHKGGRMRVRSTTLANILSARGMGRREAWKRLGEMERIKHV